MKAPRAQCATALVIVAQILCGHSTLLPSYEQPVIDDFSKLPLDSNGRLADNWLLYQDTPQCKVAFAEAFSREDVSGRQIAPCSINIIEVFFAGQGTFTCSAVTLTMGTSQDLISHTLPRNMFSTPNGIIKDDITSWIHAQQTVEAGWVSHHKADLELLWISPDGEKILSGNVLFGETNSFWITTRLGHVFEAYDPILDVVVQTFIIRHHSFFVVGKLESRTFEMDVTREVEDTFKTEWHRSRAVKRTFTDLGFHLGKLPLDLWSSMSSYHYNNRNNKALEEWDSKGIYVNWWESDVFIIGMPWDLKKYWQARLQTLVEAWSGVELELTDIYGMRRYEEGARLLSHVDRETTHAASLIVNVAQGGMREPWAVEIYDFADRLHEITMEEGDIVYYESARCLHGRMKPLKGAFYVNLFAHYRPIGDPDWFKKENPADGVPQLIDVGDCQLVGNKTACTNGNNRLPFLSPTLEKLTGPHDLLRYWKQTAPAKVMTVNNDEL